MHRDGAIPFSPHAAFVDSSARRQSADGGERGRQGLFGRPGGRYAAERRVIDDGWVHVIQGATFIAVRFAPAATRTRPIRLVMRLIARGADNWEAISLAAYRDDAWTRVIPGGARDAIRRIEALMHPP